MRTLVRTRAPRRAARDARERREPRAAARTTSRSSSFAVRGPDGARQEDEEEPTAESLEDTLSGARRPGAPSRPPAPAPDGGARSRRPSSPPAAATAAGGLRWGRGLLVLLVGRRPRARGRRRRASGALARALRRRRRGRADRRLPGRSVGPRRRRQPLPRALRQPACAPCSSRPRSAPRSSTTT